MKHAPTDNRESFKRVAWPFLPDLLRTARFLTRNSTEAEDLVQDSFLKAWRAFGSFREGTDIRAWLLTILRRTHIDHLRANGRHVHCLSLDQDAASLPESASTPAPKDLDGRWSDDRQMVEQFGDETIVEALRSLPEDIRWTVLLVHVEQLDQNQAAAIMGVPVGTVKSRAYRGRQMIKKWLMDTAASMPTTDRECVWCKVPEEQCSPEVLCSHAEPCPATCAS